MSLILYYEKFNGGDLGDIERKKFNAIIKDLKEKGGTHQGRINTIFSGNFPCLRAKLSNGGRLLFTQTRYNNEGAFIMLEVIPGHEYKKSKYLNSKFFRDVHETTEIKVEVREGEVIKKLSGTGTVETKDLRENFQRGHWLGKLITFSAKQEDIVENAEGKYNLPLIISGSAGSGKTSVALEKLRRIEDKCEGDKQKKILYIAQSASLIKESKKLYGCCDGAAGEIPQQIEFLSVHEFMERATKQYAEMGNRVEGKKPINRNAFSSWFNKICKKKNFCEHEKDGNKIFEEFIAVIGGGLLGKDQYANLGGRQSIFPKEKRANIYSLFEEYKKFIEGSSEYYDTSLIAHECAENVQANYDAVVVDEVQDLTESTLKLILKSLKDDHKNNFLLCGDGNQMIHPSSFSTSRLKDFLVKYIVDKETKLKVCTLEENNRNSKQVIELANLILHFRNHCFASEDKMTADEKEAFFIKSDTKNTGNVCFIAKGKKQEIAKEMPKSINWAVLVLDDENKKDARKLFKTPLVFNIHEAKGLEFEDVILYKFTSHKAYNDVWDVARSSKNGKKEKAEDTVKRIRDSYSEKNVNPSRPKDKEDNSFKGYKFYINALYVAATRAINNVYIIYDGEKCNLLKVIEPEEKVNVSIENIKKEESSSEEWKDMALELIDKENIEQVKGIVEKFLLNKKEYVQEIIDALAAKGYHVEAQEISNGLQSSLGKGESEQTMRSSPESETDIEDLDPQFSQKYSMGGAESEVPTKKASAENNKKIFNRKRKGGRKNKGRSKDEGVSTSRKGFVQEKKPPKLNPNSKLWRIIAADHLSRFIKETKQAECNKEEMLFVALEGQAIKIAKHLIDQGANVNTKGWDGDYPLHYAARNGHEDMVKLLLQKGAIHTLGDSKFTPSHIAAQEGKKDIVELLVKHIADVNVRNGYGDTLLHIAAQEGKEDVVEFLLQNKPEVNAINNQGVNPLYKAARNGHKNVVKLLLDHGAEVDFQGPDNLAPLYFAARSGRKDIVELLLGRGGNINIRGPSNVVPLHMAAQNNHKDIVELLLEKGADINAKIEEESLTPLALALKQRSSETVNFLLTHPNINVGCIEIKSAPCGEEDTKNFIRKRVQDGKLFGKVKEAAEKIKNGGELDESLKEELENLLKPESEYNFKPGLNYSPDGNDKNTTINIAIRAGGKILQLLYDYAKENMKGTEIFKRLKHAEEQQENSRPKSDLGNVSVFDNSIQAQGF